MIIVINGVSMNLQENDEVEIDSYSCDTCGSHKEVTVTRNGKQIAHFGEYVTLIQGKNEILGDVVAK